MQIITRGSLTAALLTLGFGSSVFAQTAPQNFISVTPCRIADTRTSSGGSGPIAGGSYQTFPVVGASGVDGGSACGIPANASAFSLNVTAAPNPSGNSLLYLSVLPATSSTPTTAPSSSTLNDPSGTIIANAAIVPSGVNGAVMVYVSSTSDVILDIDGYFVDQTMSSDSNTALGTGAGGTGSSNTAVGYDAFKSGSGADSIAVGASALANGSSGDDNIALGVSALTANTTGNANVAIGLNSLRSNTTGSQNIAIGEQTLLDSNGNHNIAIGYQTLIYTSGSNNTAVGDGALYNTSAGADNIALGFNAGYYVNGGNYNIDIGNTGNQSDSGVIRIGTGSDQGTTYIAGIYGAAAASGSTVLITSSGLLGTLNSSIRFKEDVHEMAGSTDALMQLRPVEFRYKQAAEDGSKPLQFGLIAEEVAKVYPELVVRGTDGQIDSVKYHELPAMLLNEIQKQHRIVEEMKAEHAQEIQSLKAEVEVLRALLVSK